LSTSKLKFIKKARENESYKVIKAKPRIKNENCIKKKKKKKGLIHILVVACLWLRILQGF
jgi:hypothetical protein